MAIKYRWCVIIFGLLTAVISATSIDFAIYGKDVKKIKSDINRELSTLSNSTEIEEFFDKRNIPGGWDRNRYSAIIRHGNKFRSISIDVFVDERGYFVGAEVEKNYTWL